MAKGRAGVKPSRAKKPSRCGISLTRDELELLRDIMGLVVPVHGEDDEVREGCLSEMLAEVTSRDLVEETLWKKVSEACARAGVGMGDAAPTFAVSVADMPTLRVYEL